MCPGPAYRDLPGSHGGLRGDLPPPGEGQRHQPVLDVLQNMYRIFWEGLSGEDTAQTPVKQEEKVGNFTISMSSLLVSGKASFRQINQLFFGHFEG